jgi:hypothetical protein
MTTSTILDLVKQAISELPTDSVGDATRMAFAALEENTLVPGRKLPGRLAQVIKHLEAIQFALQSKDVAPDDVNRQMRKKMDLPFAVPPFDIEEHDDWVHLARDLHEHATDAELPALAKELYETHSGVMPPGPMDYTRQ